MADAPGVLLVHPLAAEAAVVLSALKVPAQVRRISPRRWRRVLGSRCQHSTRISGLPCADTVEEPCADMPCADIVYVPCADVPGADAAARDSVSVLVAVQMPGVHDLPAQGAKESGWAYLGPGRNLSSGSHVFKVVPICAPISDLHQLS